MTNTVKNTLAAVTLAAATFAIPSIASAGDYRRNCADTENAVLGGVVGGVAGVARATEPLDDRYITDTPLGLDSVEQVDGRAKLTLLDNYAPAQTPAIQQSGKSIFWTNSGYNLGVPMFGRSDGVILKPPFDVVARGVRYGTTTDPLTIPPGKIGNGNAYDFICIQVSNPNNRLHYSHIGVGPRAGFFTCEVKRNHADFASWVGQTGAASTGGVDPSLFVRTEERHGFVFRFVQVVRHFVTRQPQWFDLLLLEELGQMLMACEEQDLLPFASHFDQTFRRRFGAFFVEVHEQVVHDHRQFNAA